MRRAKERNDREFADRLSQAEFNRFVSGVLDAQQAAEITADEIAELERREDLRADCLQHAVMTMPDVTDQAAILARADAFFEA